MCNVKPIRTEEQYDAALARIAGLSHAQPGTPEANERELLAELAELYEYNNIPCPPPQGLSAIWSWIDRKGVTLAELETEFDGEGNIRAALDGKEDVTAAMAEALGRRLGVPAAEVLRMAALPSLW